tara:strand:+ start:500 stop:856 length:357 start_codon:yes stop_codon:yes gene_type:complete
MKLTKSKLNRLIKEELQILLNEGHGGAYEDDPLFQQGVDQEYGNDAPQTLGDLAALVGVADIEKYFQDMGYMIVPVEDFQMSPDQAGDYEASAAKTDAWDMTKGGTGARSGGMGRGGL